MPGFSFILLMLCTASCFAKRSIFLLGDSVSQRIFKDGFLPVLNCSKADPNILFSCETSDYYRNDRGRVCTKHNVSRVGYMIHFGVFASHYYSHWPGHKPHGGTDNSRTNVLNAVKEFQHRTNGTDDSVLFMFHSGAWDHARYEENKGLYSGAEDWLNQYQEAYMSLMLEIRAMLRKQDELVIATMHEVKVFDVRPMNERAKRVAAQLHIPVFDQASVLGPNITYLVDDLHQTRAASVFLSKNILNNNFAIIPFR